MATYFNTHSTWMNLKSEEEINVLTKAMQDVGYDGKIKDVSNENGKLTVMIERPESSVSTYLTGDDYVKWEKVKQKVYAYRRKKGS